MVLQTGGSQVISTLSRPRAVLAAPPRSLPLLFIIGAVVLLAISGAILGVSVITTPDDPAHQPPAWTVGDEVPTSFGAITIRDVSQLAGLSADDLAGVTHGVGDLVPPDKEQVELSVIVSNTSNRAVSYSFQDEFRMVTSTGAEVTQLPGSSSPLGKLSGSSSLTTQLRFMAPRDGGALILEFREPGARHASRVLIGATDQAPAGVLDGYTHNHATPSDGNP
jgi:hypothetical protein